jgi:hypothetical protein
VEITAFKPSTMMKKYEALWNVGKDTTDALHNTKNNTKE